MTDHSALIERLEAGFLSSNPHHSEVYQTNTLLAEAAKALRDLTEWRDIADAPDDGTRALVNFAGAGPIVAFREDAEAEYWTRYLGYGKSALWPTIHADHALGWLPLPSAPNQVKEAGE